MQENEIVFDTDQEDTYSCHPLLKMCWPHSRRKQIPGAVGLSQKHKKRTAYFKIFCLLILTQNTKQTVDFADSERFYELVGKKHVNNNLPLNSS